MADLRQCSNTEPHGFHGWVEDAPNSPMGHHFHVCNGIPDPADKENN
jgi:hypothetical protein